MRFVVLALLLASCAGGLRAVKQAFPESCRVQCHDRYEGDAFGLSRCFDDCDGPAC